MLNVWSLVHSLCLKVCVWHKARLGPTEYGTSKNIAFFRTCLARTLFSPQNINPQNTISKKWSGFTPSFFGHFYYKTVENEIFCQNLGHRGGSGHIYIYIFFFFFFFFCVFFISLSPSFYLSLFLFLSLSLSLSLLISLYISGNLSLYLSLPVLVSLSLSLCFFSLCSYGLSLYMYICMYVCMCVVWL